MEMKIYIGEETYEEGNRFGNLKEVKSLEEIEKFEKHCFDESSKYSNYISAFAVQDGKLILYADGPWEC